MTKKIFIIMILLMLMFQIFSNVVYADEMLVEETNTESSNDSGGTITSTKVTRANPLSNLPEAELGLNNILSIILISIGVLLILFAIAILIKLR